MIGACLVLLLLSADPRPPPSEASPAFIATTVRVHLRASEELEPDHLRVLARKNVTLWLSTRSNTLRASTLETINKFSATFIALRAPVSESDARQLSQIPSAGVWLDVKDLDGARRVLGPRRLALELRGVLDQPLFEKIKKVRPALTLWHAPPEVDLLSWALFRQLPGRKVLARSASEAWPTQCPLHPPASEPTVQATLDTVLRTPGLFPCGRGPRIEVPLTVDREVLAALIIREPSSELLIDVGEDPRAISKAKRLLDDLGLK